MKATFGIILAFTVAFASATFTLTPPENRWVAVGQSTELKCSASSEIESCSWKTPYNEFYNLRNGQRVENGRLVSVSSSNKDCTLKIEVIEKDDEGIWECIAANPDESGNVDNVKGMARIDIGLKPTSAHLAAPYNNVSVLTQTVHYINCNSDEARPMPNFKWMIGDVELKDAVVSETKNLDESKWSQTLTYTPMYKHANETLRCVIAHPTLEAGEVLEATMPLRFKDEEILKDNAVLVEDPLAWTIGEISGVIVGTVVVLGLLACAVPKVVKVMFTPASGSYVADPEKGTDATNTETANGDESPEEKTDLTKEQLAAMEAVAGVENEIKKSANGSIAKIGERMATFFRMNKSGAVVVEEEETEKANGIDNDNKDDTAEKEKLVMETETEAKEQEEAAANGDATDNADNADNEEAKTNKKTKNFGGFLAKMFKKSNAGKKESTAEAANDDVNEDGVAMQEVDLTDEEVPVKEEQKQDVEEEKEKELEPEDKEAKIEADQVADEKPETSTPINTSF